jgi:predicted metal-dependent hydrolase
LIIEGFNIEIIRSKKRKKTIQARLTGEKTVRVLAPYGSNEDIIVGFVKKTVKKFALKESISGKEGELQKRAEMLRDKYISNAPDFTISYSESLRTTWGKCFIRDKNIILNPKLGSFPLWVIDYVIIHEIAHLIFPDHGKNFRALVSKYRLKERAVGYLYAKGIYQADI